MQTVDTQSGGIFFMLCFTRKGSCFLIRAGEIISLGTLRIYIPDIFIGLFESLKEGLNELHNIKTPCGAAASNSCGGG